MHKYLLPGYIGALFRVVLHPEREISGLAPEMAARFCGDRRLIGRDSFASRLATPPDRDRTGSEPAGEEACPVTRDPRDRTSSF